MKNVESVFAAISFSIAFVAGGLLALDLFVWAVAISWAGTFLTAVSYIFVTRARSRAEDAPVTVRR